MGIKRVVNINRGRDNHGQDSDNQDVVGHEDFGENRVPANGRMGSAQEALGKEEVEDKQNQHASGNENASCNAQLYVVGFECPRNSQAAGKSARHAEAKARCAGDELVISSEVDLIDCHIRDGAEDEQDQENAGDGDIDALIGKTTQLGCSKRVRFLV